jgi:hypothetical protein
VSIKSTKSGTNFGKIALKNTGVLTPEEWGAHMLNAGFPPVPRVIAEGLGTIFYESSFNASSKVSGNEHMGGWAESSAYGSESQRLHASSATLAAYRAWRKEADSRGTLYGNFNQQWGQWHEKQRPDGKAGEDEWPAYMGAANRAINGKGIVGQTFHAGTKKTYSDIPGVGLVEEGVDSVMGGVQSAEDFLGELASTILDFRKLGQLFAEAVAWFLRLIMKAIWDYVIAPLWHWCERAESFYWRNFFGVGTEQGSGFGYQLRQNAGIITIGFWAIGYAVLWSDGESLSPSKAGESMLGKTFKGVEGKIARRNLIKPDKVEAETPDKPEPKSSTVQIERVKELAVSRKRPVSVTAPGESVTGRNPENERSGRVPRPETESESSPPEPEQKQNAEQKIILPGKVQREINAETKKTDSPKAAAASGAGKGPRTDSGNEPKGSGGTGRAA